MSLYGKEQATDIRSFRRKMERVFRTHFTDSQIVHKWVESGMSKVWREHFNGGQERKKTETSYIN